MHDRSIPPLAAPIEILSDNELEVLIARCRSELAAWALSTTVRAGDEVRTKLRKHPQRRAIKKLQKNKRDREPVSKGFTVVRSPEASVADIRRADPAKKA